MCYHIVRWYDSVRAAPAIRRCYHSMSAAQTARRRGIKGDRSDLYLDPTDDLALVKCRHDSECECGRWPRGHNSDTLPGEAADEAVGVRTMPQRATCCRRDHRPPYRGTHALLPAMRRTRRIGLPIQTPDAAGAPGPRRRCGAGICNSHGLAEPLSGEGFSV